MNVAEFQALRVGDRVLVHDQRRGYQLRQGVVISVGHFDPQRPGVHAGVQLVDSTAVLYPSWGRLHHDPRDPSESCPFCARLAASTPGARPPADGVPDVMR
jgi:hypothetical protein